MNNVKCDKEGLLQKVMEYDFAVIDAGMYLDTHPDDYDALDYFRRMSVLAEGATAEYEEKYGTLTIGPAAVSDGKWNWTECRKIWEA